MNRFLTALLVVFLVSCDSGESPRKKSADGYNFGEKEYEKLALQVEIVLLKDQNEFDQTAKKYVSRLDEIQAFSRLFPSENKCIIYIKDPSWTYQPEYIGHELSHCVWGRWH